MAEVVLFGDVEALTVRYLKDVLDDTHVSTKVPAQRPTRMVKITRVGGTRRDLVTDQAVVTFECWDADDVAASELGRTARAHIGALEGTDVDGVWVRKVTEVGGLAYFPDPKTDLPRYQFTAQIEIRGQAL